MVFDFTFSVVDKIVVFGGWISLLCSLFGLFPWWIGASWIILSTIYRFILGVGLFMYGSKKIGIDHMKQLTDTFAEKRRLERLSFTDAYIGLFIVSRALGELKKVKDKFDKENRD